MSDIVPKFVDDATTVVDFATAGLCTVNSKVQRIANTNVIVSASIDPTKVLLVCGGGSGHEPAHVGYVVRGWLSAAVCGSVFASPPTAHVSAAIEHLAALQGPDGPGILVIIKNYAGDILNFEFAVRQAREQGIQVATTLSADDAVFGTEETGKRRGVAGCCLLYKILGAAAAGGASLAQLKALADRVSSNMRSIGASLSSCALPGFPPSLVLPAGTVEIGLGIHGEKGLVQVPYAGAQELAAQMMDVVLGTSAAASPVSLDHPVRAIPAGSKVLLLVNNLGSTTDLEMNVMAYHAVHLLDAAKLMVVGVHVGRHMTSLDMHGVSFTVLAIEDEGDIKYMMHTNPVQQPLMNFHAPNISVKEAPGPLTALQVAKAEAETKGIVLDENGPLYRATRHIFEKLVPMEATFNALDAEVGDGDLGSGVHRASLASLEMLPFLPWEHDVSRTFGLLSKAVADACAGTSGPLYGALLIGGGSSAQRVLSAGGSACDALRGAIAQCSDDVQQLGGARKGDRTMVDVLEAMRDCPKVAQAQTVPELVQACHVAAKAGAAAASQLRAKFGRSRYMNGKEVGMKDPGAELIVFWLEALATMQ